MLAPLAKKRLKFFLQLEYPMQVVMDERGFSARHPDLPSVRVAGNDLGTLYQRLDAMRRDYIRRRVESGLQVPLPYSEGLVERMPAPLDSDATVEASAAG